MQTGNIHPLELVVYECYGNQPPHGEPRSEGFLGIWPEAPFYYLFFDRPAPMVNRWIAGQPGWSLRETYRMPYAQWQDVAQRDFDVGPFRICVGLSPVASMGVDVLVESHARPGNQIPIAVRPGVAFGSGVHPTTRGCLLAIAELYESVPPGYVVDLGTGTGILAVACAMLGASAVCALDCNPVALREAACNVRMNGVERAVHLLLARSLDVVREGADLLIMNIEWPCLNEVLRDEGWMRFQRALMSGFLVTQWEQFTRLIPPTCRIASRRIVDGWVTAVVECNARSAKP